MHIYHESEIMEKKFSTKEIFDAYHISFIIALHKLSQGFLFREDCRPQNHCVRKTSKEMRKADLVTGKYTTAI